MAQDYVAGKCQSWDPNSDPPNTPARPHKDQHILTKAATIVTVSKIATPAITKYISQLSHFWKKISNTHNLKGDIFIWLAVSDDSFHGWLSQK